jgi:spore coat polysaccharide biosynthesis protein SpsF
MGSTRLPGKVLEPILGRPLLERVVERLGRVATPHHLVLATSTDPRDDEIATLGTQLGVMVHRGSESDVLSRFADAAAVHGLDPVTRITADCPLLDPGVVDGVLSLFRDEARGCDYASNTLVRTFPRGLDVEVMSAAALRTADAEATEAEDREHVTRFVYRRPDRFRLCSFVATVDRSEDRWTVDTAEDLGLVRAIYERLYPANPAFGLRDILELLDGEPALRDLNAGIVQRGDPAAGPAP